jgi:CDGSH-type Zn-finger protein
MRKRLKIVTLDNGPYLAKGSLMLLDAEGDEFRAKRATVALCRCGGSTNKPFCDGTHFKTGFVAAERSVRQVEGRV